MASVMDWFWIFCRLGVYVGILPLEGVGQRERKVTFRVWSVPFVWSMLLVLVILTLICIQLSDIQEWFEGKGNELGDRLGFYVVTMAGFGVMLSYFLSATSTARNIPDFLEEMNETWMNVVELNPIRSSRSFIITGVGCACFFVADALTVWVAIKGIQHFLMIATVSLTMILMAGFTTLFLLVAISCQVGLQIITPSRRVCLLKLV